ncbi:hypothetical protein SPF06_00965 [Sinomonas sp. JGH33]|uniref:Uncharacterized protein n=1 Tax=Sinomonas terricola TaxID=3110330 RepID=A0ABU5T1B1_9MICC|nr:hypothetical protein [Sinomonas sp. JGH33]MEA5453281.1 hypothetical protein [Sinomonas sp. JGH33]
MAEIFFQTEGGLHLYAREVDKINAIADANGIERDVMLRIYDSVYSCGGYDVSSYDVIDGLPRVIEAFRPLMANKEADRD